MSIRRLTLTGLGTLALITSCSTDSQSPPRGTATPSASTSTAKCTDFAMSDYVGKPEGNTVSLKALGWNVIEQYWVDQGLADHVNEKTIVRVSDPQPNCTLVVTVQEPPLTDPSTPAGPPEYASGTYLVGQDMDPGSYKSDGSSSGCYWARMKDDSGNNIIANNFSQGPARFTAKKGEYVKISGCYFVKA